MRLLEQLVEMTAAEREMRGELARAMIGAELSKTLLCGRFCDVLERGAPYARSALRKQLTQAVPRVGAT